MERARRDIADGFERAVDLDLDRFFDRVQYDALMAGVARRVKDKRVLKLTRSYLKAGAMASSRARERGRDPRGLSAQFAALHVYLDDLDRMLERRGHHFVRYVDDSRSTSPPSGRQTA